MKGISKYFFVAVVLLSVICIASATPVSEYIDSSRSWTCPTNVFKVQVAIVAGGGGGQGGNASYTGYAGYNSTPIYLADYPTTPGLKYPIVVGSGGLPSIGVNTQPLYSDPSIAYGSPTSSGWKPTYGTSSTAFGYTSYPGSGGTRAGWASSAGFSLDGYKGYGTGTYASAGGSGFGSATASYGGSAGIGYGAGGGGGGSGGTGGTGGNGGVGASGVVIITYDTDASSVMIRGTTYDALTGAALPSTSIVFTQGIVNYPITSDGATGAFTVSSTAGLSTGYTITETISKAGYYTEVFSFVPYVSQIVPQSVSLIPTTFNKYANGTISGIFRDQYGSSISTVAISMTNTTGGVLSTSGTDGGMYYFTNVPRMSTWYATATKSGYANSSTTFEMGYY